MSTKTETAVCTKIPIIVARVVPNRKPPTTIYAAAPPSSVSAMESTRKASPAYAPVRRLSKMVAMRSGSVDSTPSGSKNGMVISSVTAAHAAKAIPHARRDLTSRSA